MERFQSGLFRRIVLINMCQALILSITGIVDSAVAGHYVGEAGLAGMKLAMPVFSVQYMIGGILSTGLAVRVTWMLAEGKRERANRCFTWVCTAAATVSVILMLSAGLFPDALTGFFAGNTSDQVLYGNVKAYLITVLLGSLAVIGQIILSGIAALEGANRILTYSIAAILVSDIAGDFLAVILHAGIKGIAIASIAAYFCSCLVLVSQFIRGKTIFRFARLKAGDGMLAAVIVSGAPVAVKHICEFVYPMTVNRMMLSYGSVTGLAALSIQDAAHYLPLAFCDGISAAVLLLTGMFAAERDSEALRRERRDIWRYSMFHSTVIALILMAAAPLMVKLFTKDPELQNLATAALRWYLLGLPFISVNDASVSYLQGMGKQREASGFTLINQLVLPVMITWLLASHAGMTGIFASFSVHQIVLALILICIYLINSSTGKAAYGEEIWEETDAALRGNLSSLEEVSRASEEVIRLCENNGVDRKQAYNVGLCLEELATNSLLHGYKDNRTKYLDFRFIITGNWMILRLRDNGRPFDLTERYKILNPDDPVSGLGLRVIFAAAEDVSYSHVFNMNNVCIRVYKQNSNCRLTD